MQRPLLLSGFMATGKSSVARNVAERAGRPFLDLDQCIERSAGSTVAQIFRERGEPAFRTLERAELERILAEQSNEPPVVALGGGSLVDRAMRLSALEKATVVTLQASADTILARASSEKGRRPLLDVADPRARIEELLEARRSAYCESHATLATDRAPVAELAARALELWQRDLVAVAAGDRSYSVEVGAGMLPARLPEMAGHATLVLLVTDQNVRGFHGALAEASLAKSHPRLSAVVLEPGEEHKHIGSVERIWRSALEAGADRGSVVVALGGGVVSDVAGFAAASFMRGVRWAVAPTTLLAMVDASVGGKTGVDLGQAKNAVGAFWQPSAVCCDVEVLATEPERGFVSALAEVVKTALIGDRELLELLEREQSRVRARDAALLREIVLRSVRVKARVVSLDEREAGLRAILNLGHTLGHALEAHGKYTRLTHGEAVALGLVAALKVGERLGKTPRELVERTTRLLAQLGLPTDLAQEPLAEASALIGHDKKRAGSRLSFVLARDVERVETEKLSLEELGEQIRALS